MEHHGKPTPFLFPVTHSMFGAGFGGDPPPVCVLFIVCFPTVPCCPHVLCLTFLDVLFPFSCPEDRFHQEEAAALNRTLQISAQLSEPLLRVFCPGFCRTYQPGTDKINAWKRN